MIFKLKISFNRVCVVRQIFRLVTCLGHEKAFKIVTSVISDSDAKMSLEVIFT